MAKRNTISRYSELEDEELDTMFEDEEKEEVFAEPEPEKVKMVLMKDLKLTVVGPITGEKYVFYGAGSRVDVDKRDANEMLKKRPGSACCPGSGVGHSTPYFDLA